MRRMYPLCRAAAGTHRLSRVLAHGGTVCAAAERPQVTEYVILLPRIASPDGDADGAVGARASDALCPSLYWPMSGAQAHYRLAIPTPGAPGIRRDSPRCVTATLRGGRCCA